MGLFDKAKDLIKDNREKVHEGIEKAEEAIKAKTDDRTDGRVEQIGDKLQDALAKLDDGGTGTDRTAGGAPDAQAGRTPQI